VKSLYFYKYKSDLNFKDMKKILFAITILIFVSCMDNEENINPVVSDFIGTWNLTSLEIVGNNTVSYDNISYTTMTTNFGKDFDFTITFSENPNEYTTTGKFTSVLEYEESSLIGLQNQEYEVTAEESLDSGTWAIEDNKLTIENGFEELIDIPVEVDLDQINGISIKSISANEIILEDTVIQDLYS